MALSFIRSLFLLLSAVEPDLGTKYTQVSSHTGKGFLKSFSVLQMADPTHGRVNYVDSATALRQNLTYASGTHFVLGADASTVLDPNGPGRNSIRMQSNKKYSTSVTVINLRHMPEGCGTWPAIWTLGSDWPHQGEIDILEGVNNQGPNQVALHTAPGCSMPANRLMTGTPVGNNCDATVNFNAGCGVHMSDTRSYGPLFNKKGGGWFAMERTNNFIKVWFWSRAATHIPSDVLNGATSVDTSTWGTPRAYFPSTSCNIPSFFGPHNIIINLTFCGDWAGSTYALSGCPSTCVNFVNNNPAAFKDAYFDFEWLKIYE